MGEEETEKKENEKKLIEQGKCPVCNALLVHKEGCIECSQCGWTMCAEA